MADSQSDVEFKINLIIIQYVKYNEHSWEIVAFCQLNLPPKENYS